MIKEKKFMIIGVFLLLISLVGGIGTYAWLTWKSTSNTSLTMNIGKLADVTFVSGNDITTNKLAPVFNYTDGEITTFSINNRNTEETNLVYSVNLNITSIADELKNENLKYILLKDNDKVSEGNFSQITTGNNLLYDGSINSAGISEFKFYLYIDGNEENDLSMMNKNLTGTLEINGMTSVRYIIYNANGGTGAPNEQEYEYADSGTIKLSSKIPTREGHTFLGWSLDRNATAATYLPEQDWNKNTENNVTLYAIWKANAYTINYNANGGTGSSASQTVAYGKEWTTKDKLFTKTGYTQVGWNTKADGTGSTYSLNRTQTAKKEGNITLYAVWQINKVIVRFNTNGGTLKTQTIYNDKTYNWSADENGTISRQYENGILTPDFFTINYGGQTVDTGLPDRSPSSTYLNVTKSGYTTVSNKAWICKSGCTTSEKVYSQTDVYKASDFCDASAGNCTVELNANWKQVFTITYNANGGTGAPASQEKIYGESMTISSIKPTREGHTFVSWNSKADGSGSSYSPGTAYTSIASTTLYAIWKANAYTITYDANGGTGTGATQTVTFNEKWTTKDKLFTKTGYTQVSWNTKADGTGTTYSLNKEQTAKGAWDLTLYAVWKVNKVIVRFNTNGGTLKAQTVYDSVTYNWTADENGTISRQTGSGSSTADFFTINYGGQTGSVGLPDRSDSSTYLNITKSGYTTVANKAWVCKSGCTTSGKVYNQTDVYKASDFCNASAGNCTVELNANWKQVFTITYNANGGTGAPASQEKIYGESMTISSTKPTRTGYTFVNWNSKSDGSGSSYSPGTAYTSIASTTLYAIWKINTYTITYDANGGTGTGATQTVTFNEKWTTKDKLFTKTGYTQVGWNTKADGTGTTYSLNKEQTAKGAWDLTLYAKWQVNKVIVRFNTNGGTLKAQTVYDSVTYNWTANTNGTISRQTGSGTSTTDFFTISYGGQTGSSGLPNRTDSATYLNVTKSGYTTVASKAWVCKSGCTTSGKVYNQTDVYKASDFCNAANGNCTVELNVNWKQVLKITYNANGGSGAPASQNKIYGESMTISSTKPTRTGYTFVNWNSKADGSGSSYSPGTAYTSLASTTLYAIWKASTYTITYNANGGSGAPSSQTYTYDPNNNTVFYLREETPTRSGYTFLGWSLSSSASSAAYTAGQRWGTHNADNYTLYAVWEKVQVCSSGNHSFTARGIKVVSLPATWSFSCSHGSHNTSYIVYCSKCGMSALYYRAQGGSIDYTLTCPISPNFSDNLYNDCSLASYNAAKNISGGTNSFEKTTKTSC